MNRRIFITALGSAAAWPLTARAQQPERIRRIGVLLGFAEKDAEGERRIAAFRNVLGQAGWVEGRNLRLDWRRGGTDVERIATLAKELVALQPDVILGQNTPQVAALLKETRTIPIVFVGVSDPVGSQFVANFPHPGGNATGFTNLQPALAGKWVELLKEIVPNISKATLIFNPDTAPVFSRFLRSAEGAGVALAVKINPAPVHNTNDIESVIAAVGGDPHSGLIVLPSTFTTFNRSLIITLANLYRIPAIYPYRYFADEKGLIAYGIDTVDSFQRAASYIDHILNGTKVDELPVQQPTKFELVINLKTARTLGFRVPPMLLALADEVIE